MRARPERQRYAYGLRYMGLTYRAIGERLGVTGQQAERLVRNFGRRHRLYRPEDWEKMEGFDEGFSGERRFLEVCG